MNLPTVNILESEEHSIHRKTLTLFAMSYYVMLIELITYMNAINTFWSQRFDGV